MEKFEAIIGVNFFTALFVLLNTLTVFLVGKKFLFGPVMNMIRQRQEEVRQMYQKARQAQDAAQALEAEYTQKLSQATETGDRLVREAVERAQKREEEIVASARQEAQALRDKAQGDIALQKKKALNDAKNEISQLAFAMAEKVVGRQLESADRDRLVDGFIDSLGDAP